MSSRAAHKPGPLCRDLGPVCCIKWEQLALMGNAQREITSANRVFCGAFHRWWLCCSSLCSCWQWLSLFTWSWWGLLKVVPTMGSSSCHLRCPSTNPSDNKYLTCRWAKKASPCSTWARRCPTFRTGRSIPTCLSTGRRSHRCPCSARTWLPRRRKVGQRVPLHSCTVPSGVCSARALLALKLNTGAGCCRLGTAPCCPKDWPGSYLATGGQNRFMGAVGQLRVTSTRPRSSPGLQPSLWAALPAMSLQHTGLAPGLLRCLFNARKNLVIPPFLFAENPLKGFQMMAQGPVWISSHPHCNNQTYELRAPRFEFMGTSPFCLNLSRPCDFEVCR